MVNRSKIIWLCICAIVLLSCGRDNFHCENARICLINTHDIAIPYAWNQYPLTDTLYPGDSTCTYLGEIYYKKTLTREKRGGAFTDFYTLGATYQYEAYECEGVYDAPEAAGFDPDIGPEYCTNGIYDPEEGELYTDCGGLCPECSIDYACIEPENTVIWQSGKVHEFYGPGFSDWGNKFEVCFKLSPFGEDTFTFGGEVPHESKAYLTNVQKNNGQCHIRISEGGLEYFTSQENHEILLIKEGDEWHISFCDAGFYYRNQGQARLASGNLTFKM